MKLLPFTKNIQKAIFLLACVLLLQSNSWGQLINENIQSWTNRGAYGSYTQVIAAGTVTMTQCMVANAAAATGTCSAGRIQLQASTGIVELPNLSSVGTVEVHLVAGGAGRTLALEYFNGSIWVNLTTFTAIGTTGATYTYVYNTASATTLRLSSPSAALYVHDIIVTANACSAPADPSGTITPAANPACTNTTLTYSAPAATIYWQTTALGTSSANPTTSPLVVSSSGTYYVRTFDGTCWSTNSVASAAITINTIPTAVTASASPNPICTGSTLTLTGGATGATSWSWSGPNSYSSSSQSPTIVGITVPAAGVYSLTATNACGSAVAANTASVTVNVVPVGGTATATLSTICNGSTTTLTLAGYSGTIQWQQSNVPGGPYVNVSGGSGGTTATYTTAAITSIKYYVARLTNSGCTTAYSTEVSVAVNPTPQGSSLVGNTICSGTGELTFTSSAGTSPFSLIINGVTYSGVLSGTPFNASPNPTFTTNYTLTSITDANGCDRTSAFTDAAATIIVTVPPTITVQPSNTSACLSTSTTISVSAIGAGITYQWQSSPDNATWSNVVNATPVGATYTNETTNTLTVSSTSNITVHYYRCVVSGTCPPVANSNSVTFSVGVEPTIDASAVTFTQVGCTGLRINFARGNGSSRIVVASLAPITGTPTDVTAYAANPSFAAGSTIAALQYVIYNGSDDFAVCSGLTASTTYYFKIFEYNGSTGCYDYLTSGTPAASSQTTTACTQCPLLTGALINSCDGTCSEGDNELLFLNSGSYAIPVTSSAVAAANMIVSYNATSPPTTVYTNSFTTNSTVTSSLNLNTGCGTIFYDALTVGTIPPNSPIVITRSSACFNYDFSAFCGLGTVYVLYSTDADWLPGGNFVNGDIAGDLRYFRTNFSAFSGCGITDFNYEPFLLTAGGDGDAITFPSTGGAANNYSNNGCSPSAAVLPIKLLYFRANYNGTTVDLNWSTTTEINNDYFTIERSADAINFEPILAKDGAGNSSQTLFYATVDNSPLNGVSYYRLKQTDFNGDFAYSTIVSINIKNNNAFQLINTFNSENNFLNVVVNCGENCLINFELYDMTGKKVHSSLQNMVGNNQTVSISTAGLSQGIYLLKAFDDEKVITKKVKL